MRTDEFIQMLLLNEPNFDWQRSNVKINSTAETGHKVPNFSKNKI